MIPQQTLYYLFANPASGRVLDGMNNGALNSQLKTNDSHGYSPDNDQMWEVASADNGTFTIRDQHGGRYMGIGSDGVSVRLVDDDNVGWYILGTPSGCLIVQPSTGLCVTDQSSNIVLAAPETVPTNALSTTQLWCALPVMDSQQLAVYKSWRTGASAVAVPQSNPTTYYSVGTVINLIDGQLQAAVADPSNTQSIPPAIFDRVEYWRVSYDGQKNDPGNAAQAMASAYNAIASGDWTTVNTALDPTGYTGSAR